MLCAKYDYKMDISVKQEEAYEDGLKDGMKAGMNAGIEKGARDKAIENAKIFLKMKSITVEQIAQGTGLTQEEVQKLADELK